MTPEQEMTYIIHFWWKHYNKSGLTSISDAERFLSPRLKQHPPSKDNLKEAVQWWRESLTPDDKRKYIKAYKPLRIVA
jgi:hypothetical protein